MRLADMRRRRGRPAVAGVAAVVFAVLIPVLVDTLPDYWVTLCITAAISAIVLQSIGIVTDRAGMLAVAPLSFAGVGAWIVGFCNVHGWPGGFYLWLLIGGLAAVPLGLLVGLPALRLRGINLAVITLSFAVALNSLLTQWQFPGTLSYQFVQRPASLTNDTSYFLLCWLIFIAFALVVWALGRRPTGAAWRGVARSERATAAMGISVARTKLLAFVLSAFVAGISGGLVVGQVSTAVAANFDPVASLSIFAVAVLVGAGNTEGALLGGIFGAFMPELMRRIGLPQDLGNILFAVGAIQVLSVGTSMTDGWRGSMRRLGRGRVRPLDAAASVAAVGATHGADGAPAEIDDGAIASVTARQAVRRRAPDAPPALKVTGLTVRYGKVLALDGVDLEIPAGRVHGLIGPNGAGKSTLVDAVTGFVGGYEGSVKVAGRTVDGLAVHRRVRVGVRRTFQHERTIPELTVGDYVRLAAHRRITRQEINEVIALIGAPPADALIAEVDVGARRLVEIAGCVASRPEIVLFDEPTAGLAQAESLHVARSIAALPERFGFSALLIEHDMEVVLAACEHITVLDFGQTIADGAPSEVLAMGSVVSAYLGEQAVAV
jgi:branched-chain amino acid transport system permease protein